MIFKLAEDISYTSDLNTVKEIVNELSNEDLHIKQIFRVGQKNKSGNRALKVIFFSAENAIKLIKSKEGNITTA